MVFGPAGVGKSRLADQALAAAEQDGWSTGRAGRAPPRKERRSAHSRTCCRPTCSTHWLTRSRFTHTSPGRSRRGAAVTRSCSWSTTCLGSMHRRRRSSGSCSTRTRSSSWRPCAATKVGSARPTRCSGVSTSLRIDLGELSPTEVDTLLHLALRAPVDGATGSALWHASQGNPLILRELVTGARASGQLVEDHGVWRVVGPLLTTPRLLELVERRLAAVGDDGRQGAAAARATGTGQSHRPREPDRPRRAGRDRPLGRRRAPQRPAAPGALARPPALRRRAARGDPPAARADDSCSTTRRASRPTGDEDAVIRCAWRLPGSMPVARLIPICCSQAPASPATDMTSRR